MADNTGREEEEALFEIIRSPRGPDDRNEEDDGSQYLEIPKSFSSSDISYVDSWNINWKSIEGSYQDTQHTNPNHKINKYSN